MNCKMVMSIESGRKRLKTPIVNQETICFLNDWEVPDWLLIEILVRLPVRSIFKFKCVSKHWLSLISDPIFSRSFTARIYTTSAPWTILYTYTLWRASPAKQMGVLSLKYRSEFNSPNFELKFLPRHQQDDPIIVLATSNGLLLCCATELWHSLYYICNPLTGQWIALPEPPRIHQWVTVGFISKNYCYKVVRITGFGAAKVTTTEVLNMEIFCSNTGEWRDVQVSCPYPVQMFMTRSQAVLYNGILHWSSYNGKIIAYDPDKNADQCRLMDFPKDRTTVVGGLINIKGVLGMCSGKLCYFEVASHFWIPFDMRSVGVWVLKNYDTGEWCLENRTKLSDLWIHPKFNKYLSENLDALAFLPFHKDVVIIGYARCLFACNLQTRRLKLIRYEKYRVAFFEFCGVMPFVLPPWPTPIPRPTWKAV